MLTSSSVSALLTALLAFPPSFTTAQNSTFNATRYENCSYPADEYNYNYAVKSNGQVPFRFDPIQQSYNEKDYYLSVIYYNKYVEDPADQEIVGGEVLQKQRAWLSVPTYAEGSFCVYMLAGVNASASSSNKHGCDGVLSDKCLDLLQKNTSLPESTTCPQIKLTDELIEACGDAVATDLPWNQFPRRTSEPQDFSGNSCAVDTSPWFSIPGTDDYPSRTYPVVDRNVLPDQLNRSSSQWYDLLIRQTIPFVVTVSGLGDRRTSTNYGLAPGPQVVCVAPSNVTEGGRIPDLTFEPLNEDGDEDKPEEGEGDSQGGESQGSGGNNESAASHLSRDSLGTLALYAAAAVGLVLVV